MKRFCFLAFLALVLCLVGCGPKETTTPIEGTSDYVLFSLSNAPNMLGVKNAQGEVIIPNVYQSISLVGNNFVCRDEQNFYLKTNKNEELLSGNAPIEYNKTQQYYVSKESKGSIKIYLPENGNTIVGSFEGFVIDSFNNLCILKEKKYGLMSKEGSILVLPKHDVIKIANNEYIALDAKKEGSSIYDKDKKINWRNVKVTAYDKTGKEVKAPSLVQLKKLIK